MLSATGRLASAVTPRARRTAALPLCRPTVSVSPRPHALSLGPLLGPRAAVGTLAAIIAILGILGMAACRPAATPAGGAREMPAADVAPEAAPAAAASVTLTGWFQTVWGDAPHYLVVDDAGRSTELLLSAEIAQPLGGARALDRKKVKVTGTRSSPPPGALRVSAIQLDTGGK